MTSTQAAIQPISVGPDHAGKITGLTRSAIYDAIARGELKSFKYGKRRLILIKELEAWVNRLAKDDER